MKNTVTSSNDAMRENYDISQMKGVVRGKYIQSNPITLEKDVAKVFPDSESVNSALRMLIKVAEQAHAK